MVRDITRNAEVMIGTAAAAHGPEVATDRRVRSVLIALLAAGTAAWSAFAWAVMPRLLQAAHAGRGLPFLVDALEYRQSYPLDHYLAKWNAIAVAVLVAWVAGGMLLLITTTRGFARRFVGTATPGTLGAIRMLVCITLAGATYELPLREVAGLPDTQRVPMGVMDLFYAAGWAHIAHDVALIETLRWACFGLCLLGALGYRTRGALPLLAVLYLPLAGTARSLFWFSHSGLIPYYCLTVLCLSRSGDGWSVDRMLRIRRGDGAPRQALATPHYAWARLAIWLCICVPYTVAGLSKLRFGSWKWWDANNMQNVLFTNGLQSDSGQWALKLVWVPPSVFALVGLATVIVELGMITVPFFRTPRRCLPIAMVSMHLATGLLMGIPFYDLIVLQAVFYDWSPVARRLASSRVGRPFARLHAVKSEPQPLQHERGALPHGAAEAAAAHSRGRARNRWLALIGPQAGAAAVAFVVWLLFGVWMLRLEFYPLTSMQMFATYAPTSIVDYYRAYVTYEDGTTALARFEQMGGGVPRYGPMLEWGFRSDKGRQAAIALMARSAEWWNTNAATPGKHIVRVEAHHRQWDFAYQRHDDNWGSTVEVLPVDVPSFSTSAKR